MKTRRGFTLIELIVVIAIIVILLTLIIPSVGRVRQRARIARASSEIAALETAITAYFADMGYYPTDNPADPSEADNTTIITQLSGRSGGIGAFDNAIVNDPDWNGPYMEFDAETIDADRFVDPWHNPYVIEIDLDGDHTTAPPTNNALTFDIRSNGPDGTAGNGDDITNY